jgi:lipopolysaccharide export system protein LptA
MQHAVSKSRKAFSAALAAGCAAALALAADASHAQLSAKQGPIDITSDSMDVHDPQRLVIFKGKVEALQDDQRLRSDVLNVYYKSAPKVAGAPKAASAGGADLGDVDHMEAIGNVYFVTPTRVARGDKAVYTADNKTIVMTGDVVLTEGENVGRGTRLTINLANNNSTLEGGPGGPTPRSHVVIYPKQSSKTPQGTGR